LILEIFYTIIDTITLDKIYNVILFISALSREPEKLEHWYHHLPQLRQARPAGSLPRDDGPRDGPQLRITGKSYYLILFSDCLLSEFDCNDEQFKV
jgi:hypothetical protein